MGNFLVIGGSGYVGSVIVQDLLAAGNQVCVVDNFTYGKANAAGCLGWIEDPSLTFVNKSIDEFCEDARCFEAFDATIVLAGLVGDPITKKFPEIARATNDISILSLLSKLSKGPEQRVIFVSTCSNYGLMLSGEYATEESQLQPLSLYAKSKVRAEEFILSLQGRTNSCFTILRFATAFGLSPRMRFDLTVNEFAGILGSGQPLEVFDANTWRPYCHVRDFSRLIDNVLSSERKDIDFQIFNAGGDVNNYTKAALVEIISRELDDPEVLFVQDSADKRDYRVSFEKVKLRLGFEPLFSVEFGVQQILNAFKIGVFDQRDLSESKLGNYRIVH